MACPKQLSLQYDLPFEGSNRVVSRRLRRKAGVPVAIAQTENSSKAAQETELFERAGSLLSEADGFTPDSHLLCCHTLFVPELSPHEKRFHRNSILYRL